MTQVTEFIFFLFRKKIIKIKKHKKPGGSKRPIIIFGVKEIWSDPVLLVMASLYLSLGKRTRHEHHTLCAKLGSDDPMDSLDRSDDTCARASKRCDNHSLFILPAFPICFCCSILYTYTTQILGLLYRFYILFT